MTALTSFTFGIRLGGSVAEIRPRVEAALKAEGFGVLTEIDVQATMKEKLGIDRAPFLILGCDAPAALLRDRVAAPHVGRAPHERDGDVIDPHREAELEVAPVLGAQG